MPPRGGLPARGANGTFSQLEFKIQANFGASNGECLRRSHARINEIGRSPVICRPAAREGEQRARGRGRGASTVRSEVTGFTRHFQHTFYEKRPRTLLKIECVRGYFLDFFSPFWCFWGIWTWSKSCPYLARKRSEIRFIRFGLLYSCVKG